MFKTVQQRVIAILFVLVIIVALFAGYDRYKDVNVYNEFLEKRNSEKEASVEKVIQLYGSKLEIFSVDYSVWDDMVNFVYQKDTSWVEDNVTAFLPKFSTDSYWIFDSSYTLVHSDNVYSSEGLKKFQLPLDSISKKFDEHSLIHFYMHTDSGICDVRGATIHTTKDIDRKNKPLGYLFVGIHWNKNILNYLSQLADSKLELSNEGDVASNMPGIRFYPLNGWKGIPVSYLKMTFESAENKNKIYEIFGDENVYLGTFGFALLFSVFFLLSIWVNKPVKTLSESLKKRDSALLKELLKDKTEFGTLAHLVDGSFREQEKKDTLLKEIHHRVKNNLQVISSLIGLQSRSIQNPELLKSFNLTRDRVKSIALIHEKLYQTDDLSRIDFSVYIKNLVDHLLFSYAAHDKNITVNVNSEQIFLDIDNALPCGLIINELVSNALKYAFPSGDKGLITITFSKKNNTYHLMVADDGIGIPKEKLEENRKSLGIRLIINLIKQLKGKIQFRGCQGTCIFIEFPAETT